MIAQITHDAELGNLSKFHERAPRVFVEVLEMLLEILLVEGEGPCTILDVLDGLRGWVHERKKHSRTVRWLHVELCAVVAVTACPHFGEKCASTIVVHFKWIMDSYVLLCATMRVATTSASSRQGGDSSLSENEHVLRGKSTRQALEIKRDEARSVATAAVELQLGAYAAVVRRRSAF